MSWKTRERHGPSLRERARERERERKRERERARAHSQTAADEREAK